jgi:hypothetical protein
MTEKTTIHQAPPCSDLVCTNQFMGCTTVVLSTLTPPVVIDGHFVSNASIVVNDVRCQTETITCTTEIGSGCGDIESEITFTGFFLTGTIVYVVDFLLSDLCGNQGYYSTQQTATIPLNSLLCFQPPESPFTCADINLCPTISTQVNGPVFCVGESPLFELITTFTFICPTVEE